MVPFRSGFLTAIRYRKVKTRALFEKLAHRNDIPGLKDIWSCKFLITDVDGPTPKLFFMDTKKVEHHYLYYKRVTGKNLSEAEFDSISYYSNTDRENLAGSMVAHDSYRDADNRCGIYTIEYWPTDPVSYEFMKLTWDLITQAMPFAEGRIYYHLCSQTQIAQCESEKELYGKSPIKRIETDVLFNNLRYIPLNLGDSCGILRIMNQDDLPAIRDIVIFRSLPNDLSHVRGIITDVSQPPLSHVNLKAKQNQIPNAYIKNASTRDKFLNLVGKPVHFTVTADGYEIKEISSQSLQESLEQATPSSTYVPEMNFKQTEIVALKALSKEDRVAVGAKAANMGEVHSILPEKHVIDGNAIPFYFYDCFVKANNLYEVVDAMLRDESFISDIQVKSQKLREFQNLIEAADVPDWMAGKFSEMQSQYPAGSDFRLRSSSNSEDLENFNGAGLYSSRVHFAQDGPIENTIKTVWASLWTYRAFTEREFHKIDHTLIAMGILVHLDHKNEQHNGVAVTKNIFNSVPEGFYINVQTGQSLVTNPDGDALPDELVISASGANKEYEIQTIRRSNLVPKGQSVMQKEQVVELIGQCRLIHTHFANRYQAEDDAAFAMEIEFLTTADGVLKVMQARPWLD